MAAREHAASETVLAALDAQPPETPAPDELLVAYPDSELARMLLARQQQREADQATRERAQVEMATRMDTGIRIHQGLKQHVLGGGGGSTAGSHVSSVDLLAAADEDSDEEEAAAAAPGAFAADEAAAELLLEF